MVSGMQMYRASIMMFHALQETANAHGGLHGITVMFAPLSINSAIQMS